MAKLTLGESILKKLTPNLVRVFKAAGRFGKRYPTLDPAVNLARGTRFGDKAVALRGFRRSQKIKRAVGLAGIGTYGGYRYQKKNRAR